MMKTTWKKVGLNVITGIPLGVGDQLIQNWDEVRGGKAVAAGTADANGKLPIMKQAGTYYNYGVPLLAVAGAGFGILDDEWSTRLITGGSVLAGRKFTHQLSTKSTSQTPSAAYSQWRRQAAKESAPYNPSAQPPVRQVAGEDTEALIIQPTVLQGARGSM